MRLGCACIALGALLVWQGALFGGIGWMLSWLGFCFVALGTAHFSRFPCLFGKKPQGYLPFWSLMMFLPLHAYSHLVWWAIRWFSKEAAFSIVTDRLLIGRRLLRGELPAEVDLVVDLTSEFSEPSSIVESAGYLSFLILDGATPDPVKFRAFLRSMPTGRTFIHCAQGHGRTGLFTCAYLIEHDIAQNVESALTLLVAARPALRLNREQRLFLDRLYPTNSSIGE